MRKSTLIVTILFTSGLCGTSHAGVIPPSSLVAGMTQLELADRWWPFMIDIPLAVNPVADDDGSGIASGDQGDVFFLAGTFADTPVVRTIQVPAGKPLFFPLVNFIVDNTPAPGSPPTTYTAAELRDFVTPIFDDPSNVALSLTLNGVPVPSLLAHRQTTAASNPFSYTTTSSDNLIDAVFGGDSTLGTGVYPSTVSPAVQDGFWVALDGLLPGETLDIHFTAEVQFDGAPLASQDITYHVSVPEPTTLGLLAPVALAVTRRRWMCAHR